MSFEEPPWLWSESTWPLSSAFLHHVLLVDLTFKQSASTSFLRLPSLQLNSAHNWHTALSATRKLPTTWRRQRRESFAETSFADPYTQVQVGRWAPSANITNGTARISTRGSF